MSFDINKLPSQKGRIAIITGSNIGLGYEAALALAKKEMKIILACRNTDKANQAKNNILKAYSKADLEVIPLDLSKLASVRAFATSYLDKYTTLDVLMNNAGVMVPPYTETEDGFELQLGVNHLGHFLLTKLLMPAILATPNSRVVSLSSIAHRQGRINFDDLNSKKKYSATSAYGQSKLACLMFAYELQRRLDQAGIKQTISTVAHPGVSNTNLSQHIPNWLRPIMFVLFSWATHVPANAAKPQVWAAIGDAQGGDFFGPTGMGEMKGKTGKVKARPHAHDQQVAKKLWEVSEQLIGEKFIL